MHIETNDKYLFNITCNLKYSQYGTSFMWDYRRIPERGTDNFVMRSVINVSVKVKVINERRKYNSTPFATSALGRVGSHRQPLGPFTPGKDTWYPLYKRLDRHLGRSGRAHRKSHPTPRNSIPPSAQLVASLYTTIGYVGRKVCWQWINTGLFEMIVGVLTTCHTQYTWDRRMQLHRWIKRFS